MLTGTLGVGTGYAFSDRSGGVSAAPYDGLNLGGHVGDDPAAVRENRHRAAAALGFPPERLVFMEQVHGDEVVVVDEPVEAPPTCDALVTTRPGLCLAVLVADCVPVVLADPDAGVLAAVHAGRRGVQSGVVSRAVETMCGLGAAPGRIRARLGPAVCGSCYEVPPAMQAEVTAVAPAAGATTASGTTGLDLRSGLVEVLGRVGVADAGAVGPCTREEPALYSYRREARTGRFAGFVWRS